MGGAGAAAGAGLGAAAGFGLATAPPAAARGFTATRTAADATTLLALADGGASGALAGCSADTTGDPALLGAAENVGGAAPEVRAPASLVAPLELGPRSAANAPIPTAQSANSPTKTQGAEDFLRGSRDVDKLRSAVVDASGSDAACTALRPDIAGAVGPSGCSPVHTLRNSCAACFALG